MTPDHSINPQRRLTNKPFMINELSNRYRKQYKRSRKNPKKPPPYLSVQLSTATFPVDTKDTKKNTEFAKSIKNTKDQQQRKLAPLPAVLDQPDCSYPDLHSYKIQAQG